MKMVFSLGVSIFLLTLTLQLYGEDSKISAPSKYNTSKTSTKSERYLSKRDEATKKIVLRNMLLDEGYYLAKQKLYEEALLKFKASMDPALLNYDYDKGGGEVGIRNVYIRQGKFEQALQMIEDELKSLPAHARITNDDTFAGIDELTRQRLELFALIKARDTKDTKPIYEYIDYVKVTSKYSKLMPPRGYFVGMSDWLIDDLVHLYDYMHDYDSGIALMDEIIKYHSQHPDPAHRSAQAKHVKEYERVKKAWELDKSTGQHGHLQEVIRTSDFISW